MPDALLLDAIQGLREDVRNLTSQMQNLATACATGAATTAAIGEEVARLREDHARHSQRLSDVNQRVSLMENHTIAVPAISAPTTWRPTWIQSAVGTAVICYVVPKFLPVVARLLG
jgi:hypothetical protein